MVYLTGHSRRPLVPDVVKRRSECRFIRIDRVGGEVARGPTQGPCSAMPSQPPIRPQAERTGHRKKSDPHVFDEGQAWKELSLEVRLPCRERECVKGAKTCFPPVFDR